MVEVADPCPGVDRAGALIEQLEVSKERLFKFIDQLKWSEDELELPWYKLRRLMWGFGNEPRDAEGNVEKHKAEFYDSNGFRLMTCYLSQNNRVSRDYFHDEADIKKAEESKYFILMIGHWDKQELLEYPFCAVGAARGLHIIND